MSIYPAIIEMPKGDTRRRHLANDKSGVIDLGLLKEKIPLNDGKIPFHYGYIPNTKTAEGDEVDVIILGDFAAASGDTVDIELIALLVRKDKDNKVLAIAANGSYHSDWENLPAQEKELLLNYFGYNSPIIEIEDWVKAEEYIAFCQAI